jgi:poly-gamma-glutamate synthesis protein (capsule biosynthesis protein)
MPLQTRLGFCHAMSERFLADVLAAAGIPPHRLVVSLANNHIADQAREGIEETVATLRAMGIAPVGLKSPHLSPWETVTIEGSHIACLAFTDWLDRDLRLMREVIRCEEPGDARPPSECDFACALPHWGMEFRYRPDERTRRLAARLEAMGVDVVAGTHPHVVQPLEAVGRTLVAYSLGDFLGSVLARSPSHVRLSLALAVDFVPGAPQGSRIAGYEAHPFFRLSSAGHERVEEIGALPVPLRRRVERLATRICSRGPDALDGEFVTDALAQ